MGCAACALHRGGFRTEAEFIGFRRTLADAVARGDLVDREPPPGGAIRVQAYDCCRCGARWRLAHPDWAYRGGWTKATDAVA